MAKVLLIEDDEFLRDIYKRTLDAEGIQTDAFEKGNDGLAALHNQNYDLILLDIMLPDTNGLDILKLIKSDGSKKDIPVVFLSNLGQESVIEEGHRLGAKGYLIKSTLNPDQMVREVKNFLAS
jgi:DNA-binding response OmpR family regulator